MAIDPAITTAAAASFAVLFLSAAAHKSRDFGGAAATIADYQIAPSGAERAMAAAIIGAEALIGILLLAPTTRPFAAMAGVILLAAYAAAIGLNLMRGRRDIDCGCNFGGGQPISPGLVLRNLLLGAALIFAAAPVTARTLGPFDFAMIALFTASMALCYLTIESLRLNSAQFGGARMARREA